ncbi:DUF2975 domain-containing protein [Pseudomonas fluorescens]|uniref:DUF2975 domain-containing protein n=1 Tax=Pseudomonas fluorescens TaxID=294 RepID=A0A423LM94_PSEFL|nr:DUF2975 domain-containing protein [Pseudomonas fluorescens]RON69405.1 DUF2975 domain-containing protein [Pseudomonas fluorescens]
MTNDNLARHSRLMATCTQILIIGMLVWNTACWIFPEFARQYGIGFNLTAVGLNADYNVDVGNMPGWQIAGGLFLSSIPLLMLAYGLIALRRLFQLYSEGQYFSERSSALLGKVGFGVIMWVLLSFVLTPAISVWVTFLQPPGEGFLTIAFSPSDLVSLFLAASVMVVARIHQKGTALARENNQFI